MVNYEKKIHHLMLMVWSVIAAVLMVSYYGEVIKGLRSLRYYTCFMLITLLPLLICILLHCSNSHRKHLSLIMVCGYFIMYAFVLITGSTPMVFSYILPLLSFLVLAHQSRIILGTGLASLAVNLVSILFRIQAGDVTLENSRDVEIQLALIVLCFLGAWVSARTYDQITRDNEEYLQKLLSQAAQISSQHSQLQEMQTDMEQISVQAHTDVLTGIGNRLAYERYLPHLSSDTGVGILYCDINGLKYRNDLEGHRAGDQLLLSFSTVLTRNFRKDNCFRISGDEFICVLTGIEQDTFEKRARDFYKLIQSGDPPLASLGWAFGNNAESVQADAEKWMYVDKQSFYNQYPEFRR